MRRCYVKAGRGKFCSTSCGTTYKNIHNNPVKDLTTKEKAIKSLWWYGMSQEERKGKGGIPRGYKYTKKRVRVSKYLDSHGNKVAGDIWRKIALTHKANKCEICGKEVGGRKLHIHHKDKNRNNNQLNNLQVLCVNCHNNIAHERKRNELGRFTGGD